MHRAALRGRGLVVVGLLAACSSGAGRSSTSVLAPSTTAAAAPGPCTGAPAPARYDHVVWIWMENHTSVLSSGAARYERALAATCAAATNDADVGSPSLPNYLGATSGSTWGVGDDASPAAHRLAADNLFRQVRVAGGTERSYEEAMPRPCALSSGGEYAVKHNPAAYYVGGGDRGACGADDVVLGTLSAGALAAAVDGGSLPTFAFVTPDLCDDTHTAASAPGTPGWRSGCRGCWPVRTTGPGARWW